MSNHFHQKLLPFLLLPLILSGCHTPHVTERYDEFKEITVCELDPFIIDLEGFSARRTTLLGFKREEGTHIQGIITSRLYSSLFFESRTPIPEGGTLKFILSDGTTSREEMTFKAHSPTQTSGSDVTYGAYGMTFQRPWWDNSVRFDITKEQLEKLIASPEVQFSFETKDEPTQGEFKDRHKEAMVYFLKKCVH